MRTLTMGSIASAALASCTVMAVSGAMADPVHLSDGSLDGIAAGTDLSGFAFAEALGDSFGDTSFAEANTEAAVAVDGPTAQSYADADVVGVGDFFAEGYATTTTGTSDGDQSAETMHDAYGFAAGDGTVSAESTTYAASSPTTSTAGGVSISYASGDIAQTAETSATTSGSGTIVRSSTLTRYIENDAFSASYTTSTITVKDYP